ncbi:lysoplasmalogenase [Sneathiella limimaris]|uniref:lysoplasmalogenase n=1 Tax=Sneathiella limimaris TaxID=1964213 RepID=UPI001469FC78|nr:lysoplasmalogenase [Sneathiella limimaris]
MPALTKHQVNLLLIAIGLALSYLLVPLAEGSIGNIIQKSSACVFLAILGLMATEQKRISKLLCLALLCSAAGDAFLAIRNGDYFTHGLGAFLIAHLLYISIFAKTQSWKEVATWRKGATALVVLFAASMLGMLWPELGALKAPVFIYIAVISTMALLALGSRLDPRLVVLGAISFLISDATIAINKFLYAFELSGPLIWITYIGAQVLLTLGIIKGSQKMPVA